MDSPLGERGHKPKFGMMFKSVENAYNFYNAYGREVGFSVRRDYSNKNFKTGEVTSTQYVCCNEGYRGNDKRGHLTKEARIETWVRCGAFMHIKFERDEGIYFVDRFEEKHNHKLIRKDCTHLMPLQQNISVPQAIDIELADGLPVGSSYELMGLQSGARKVLGETAKFGGALMYDETMDSFVWLFETFLKAMSYKFPKTIISDQVMAITKALALVMPETHHYLCIWHIMQNGMKHLGNVIKGPMGIRSILSEFMKEHENKDDFEICWESMQAECGVRDKWLSDMYNLRTK
ncbi:protein FAR1-RELATED SEQUENCE 7-like [Cornus florida]|uniref:protein FAR1-RELATED SEQUENCE 7-like n=1 Tax=Cornus florida TaxID=4283 RepID=UPI002896F559|nr:protein FAR1-RELATED SEQUENCE 7-like [Cornus florida]